MKLETKLGKIKKIYFGHGGYQDAMLGLHVTLGHDDGWAVQDFKGTWNYTTQVTASTKWSELDREREFIKVVRLIDDLLIKAKVMKIEDLVGKPVEVTFDGFALVSWRLLTECI